MAPPALSVMLSGYRKPRTSMGKTEFANAYHRAPVAPVLAAGSKAKGITKPCRRGMWPVGALAIVVVGTTFAAVSSGCSSGSSGVRQAVPSVAVGQLTQLEQSGAMHDILERHRAMIEKMQEDASPAMLALMNADPMWTMMRSKEWAKMDADHQADVNRMIVKP